MSEFTPERCFIVHNGTKGSSTTHNGKQFADEVLRPLLHANARFQVYQTVPDRQENIEAIAEQVMPGDLLVVWGGDGTGNAALNGAFISGYAKDIRAVYLAKGRACDISAAINQIPNPDFRSLVVGRYFGRSYPAYEDEPTTMIQIDINRGTEHQTTYAAAYTSIGATALMSAMLDSQIYRQNRQNSKLPADIYDAKMILANLNKVGSFDYYENGLIKTSVEHLYANFPRMAKYFNFAKTVNDGNLIKLTFDTFNSAVLGASKGIIRPIDGPRVEDSSILLKSDTLLETDGEVSVLNGGDTTLRFRAVKGLGAVSIGEV